MHFRGIDLSTYGLIVRQVHEPVSITADSVRLSDRAYAGTGRLAPKGITLDCVVQGASVSDLAGKLDSIKAVLNTRVDGDLKVYDDRYWSARFESMDGHRLPSVWTGTLAFIAYNPLAYSTSETSSDHSIDSDPKTVTETTSGTGYIRPVFTLTAGETLTAVTITLESLNTEESLSWTGSLADGDELGIDTVNQIVSKNGTVDMDTVDGQFPRLLPDTGNSIKVTNLSTTGSLNITYRDTYL